LDREEEGVTKEDIEGEERDAWKGLDRAEPKLVLSSPDIYGLKLREVLLIGEEVTNG
jgi:hypothetical protein